MLWFLISSPAQFAAVGGSWEKFAFAPSGTGPFKLAVLTQRARAELVRNDAYWNKARLPPDRAVDADLRARGFGAQQCPADRAGGF